MKRRLKIYLTGLLLMFCNTMAWGVQPSAESQNQEPEFSFISQQDANQQAIYNLSFIYAHTPKEVTVKPDNPINSFRNNIRLLLKTSDVKSILQISCWADTYNQTYFHPDRVEYYIYTLKKIVI